VVIHYGGTGLGSQTEPAPLVAASDMLPYRFRLLAGLTLVR
jgi:hypothetical protein